MTNLPSSRSSASILVPEAATIGVDAARPSRPPRIRAVATALPEHRITQADAKAMLARLFESTFRSAPRLLEVFDNTEIQARHACMPLEWYEEPRPFAERNALYLEHALRLGSEVCRRAMDGAGWTAEDVDHVLFVSSSGIATPSLDARLANALGFRTDVRRTPLWGLGCAGGVAGLARAADFVRADPESRVLLVALELCTLAFQRRDDSPRHLVASALFSDGAAAVAVEGGDKVPSSGGTNGGGAIALELVGASSTLWPGTLDVMGWTVDGDGLHVVFSRDIPTLVRERLRPVLDGFLERHGLRLGPGVRLIAHPGGAKVLRALEQSLELEPEHMEPARRVLESCGNMSSPTCLFVLERVLAAGGLSRGDHAVLSALGPGFAAELVLMRAR